MNINLEINLTNNAIQLLKEIKNSEEPSDYSFDLEDPAFEELIENCLVDTILGEQWYINNIGKIFLEKYENSKY